MSKFAIGLILAVVVVSNVITSTLLFSLRNAGRVAGVSDVEAAEQREAIQSLRKDLGRLADAVASRPLSSPARLDAAKADGVELSARLDALLNRLDALEKTIAAKNEAGDELAALKLREKLQEQYRADDGFLIAEELLAQGKLAAGGNGLMAFLESHPDHPDAQDLMRRARNAFQQSGYLDKALWLQGEIMKKFPEHRGGDLQLQALLEKRMKKLDDAMQHASESVELARTDQDRISRMLSRAEVVYERDGEAAGLEAYREVERAARAAGLDAEEAGKRAESIETRLSPR